MRRIDTSDFKSGVIITSRRAHIMRALGSGAIVMCAIGLAFWFKVEVQAVRNEQQNTAGQIAGLQWANDQLRKDLRIAQAKARICLADVVPTPTKKGK